MACLSFEKIEKAMLTSKIEEALIGVYDITKSCNHVSSGLDFFVEQNHHEQL